MRAVVRQIGMATRIHRRRFEKPPKLRFWKRASDFILAAALLVAFTPLMTLIALVIKCRGRPVLAAHLCIGADGLPFRRWEFCPLFGPISKAGLDQLPQLFNILNGTMSFVGPRPITDAGGLGPRSHAYFACRPGITGLWNITDVHHRSDADRRYADECSPWFDLVIVAKTLVTISD